MAFSMPIRAKIFVTITAAAGGHASVNKNVIVSDNETPYQNPRDPLDVVPDGLIIPGDVLVIVNILNNIGHGNVADIMPQYTGQQPVYPDTSGDNFITARDALLVINHLNLPVSGGGEGESAASPAIVAAPVPPRASVPSSEDSTAAALQALMADDSFWRQSKTQSHGQLEGDSDWNQVVAALAREIARRRGE